MPAQQGCLCHCCCTHETFNACFMWRHTQVTGSCSAGCFDVLLLLWDNRTAGERAGDLCCDTEGDDHKQANGRCWVWSCARVVVLGC